MTEIVQRMIDRAIESGSISLKQKNMIIAKAQKNGDDVDEVEIMLDSIPLVEEPVQDLPKIDNVKKIRKCPHCGATISGMAMTCPECGFVLSLESEVNKENRDYTLELQKKIDGIRNRARRRNEDELDYDENREKEILNAIQSFSIPIVQEGLVQCMIYCYSRYEAAESFSDEKIAWLSKAKEFYNLLLSVSNKDSATNVIIEKYAFIADVKAKGEWHLVGIIYGVLGGIAVVVLVICWLAGVFG